jgi:hypothetical protein
MPKNQTHDNGNRCVLAVMDVVHVTPCELFGHDDYDKHGDYLDHHFNEQQLSGLRAWRRFWQ